MIVVTRPSSESEAENHFLVTERQRIIFTNINRPRYKNNT